MKLLFKRYRYFRYRYFLVFFAFTEFRCTCSTILWPLTFTPCFLHSVFFFVRKFSKEYVHPLLHIYLYIIYMFVFTKKNISSLNRKFGDFLKYYFGVIKWSYDEKWRFTCTNTCIHGHERQVLFHAKTVTVYRYTGKNKRICSGRPSTR